MQLASKCSRVWRLQPPSFQVASLRQHWPRPRALAAAAAVAARGTAGNSAGSSKGPAALLETLSDEQKAAATTTDTRVRVIAGPGSGKTRVIAARVAHLVSQQQVRPSSILVITFTNKARDELQHRLRDTLGDQQAKRVTISTFHGLAYQILRQHYPLLQQIWSKQHERLTGRSLAVAPADGASPQRPMLKVVDEKDSHLLLHQLLKPVPPPAASSTSTSRAAISGLQEAGTASSKGRRSSRRLAGLEPAVAGDASGSDYEALLPLAKSEENDLAKAISLMKNFGRNVSRCTGSQLVAQMEELKPRLFDKYGQQGSQQRARLERLYDDYVLLLAREGMMDFDDLMCHIVMLLEDHPEERLRARWTHVLVDESQDTNSSQWRLLQLLTGPSNQLFMVGDPHQGIYGFRGANPDHLGSHFQHWAGPGGATHYMQDNYRSRAAIVQSAQQVLHNRRTGGLQAKRPNVRGQPTVEVVVLSDHATELQHIVTQLQQHHSNGMRWQDMAMLTRTKMQAEQAEQELLSNGIPCQLLTGAALWSRAEVKLAMALARLVASSGQDTVAVFRLVKELPICKGLSDDSVKQLHTAWRIVQPQPGQQPAPIAVQQGTGDPGEPQQDGSLEQDASQASVQAITMCEALFDGCLQPGQLARDMAAQLLQPQQQQMDRLYDALPQSLVEELMALREARMLLTGGGQVHGNGNGNGTVTSSSKRAKAAKRPSTESTTPATASSSSSSSSRLPSSKPAAAGAGGSELDWVVDLAAADKAAHAAAVTQAQLLLGSVAPEWQPNHPAVKMFASRKPQRQGLQALRGLLELGAALAEAAPPADALRVLLQVSGVLGWAARKEGASGRVGRLQWLVDLAANEKCYQDSKQLESLFAAAEGGDNGSDSDEAGVVADSASGPDAGLASLQQFVGFASLLSEAAEEEEAIGGDGRVQLMTLHASKGKEFPLVVIPHVVEGILPSHKAVDKGELQQERNLLYVGMTRAQDQLLITANTQPGRWSQNTPSSLLLPLMSSPPDGVSVQEPPQEQQLQQTFSWPPLPRQSAQRWG